MKLVILLLVGLCALSVPTHSAYTREKHCLDAAVKDYTKCMLAANSPHANGATDACRGKLALQMQSCVRGSSPPIELKSNFKLKHKTIFYVYVCSQRVCDKCVYSCSTKCNYYYFVCEKDITACVPGNVTFYQSDRLCVL